MEDIIIKTELQELAEKGNEVTLANIKNHRIRTIQEGWHDWHYTLTDQDVDQISTLLGGHYKTQCIVANKLRSLSSIPSNWCFDRISFCKHTKRWSYTAGQDYQHELNLIRTWFKNL